eukprot:6492743-Amphidinium_carterae.1
MALVPVSPVTNVSEQNVLSEELSRLLSEVEEEFGVEHSADHEENAFVPANRVQFPFPAHDLMRPAPPQPDTPNVTRRTTVSPIPIEICSSLSPRRNNPDLEDNVYGPWRNMSARNRERSEPCRGTARRTSEVRSRSAEHQMSDEHLSSGMSLEVQHDPLYSQDPWQAQAQQLLREREAQITQQQRLLLEANRQIEDKSHACAVLSQQGLEVQGQQAHLQEMLSQQQREMQIQHTHFQEHLERVNGEFQRGLEQIQQEALQKQHDCEARLGQVRDQDVAMARDEATAAITARARDELHSIIQQNKIAHDTQMVEVTAKAREEIESIAKRNQLAHDQQMALLVHKHDSEVAEYRDTVRKLQDEMLAMRTALNMQAHGALSEQARVAHGTARGALDEHAHGASGDRGAGQLNAEVQPFSFSMPPGLKGNARASTNPRTSSRARAPSADGGSASPAPSRPPSNPAANAGRGRSRVRNSGGDDGDDPRSFDPGRYYQVNRIKEADRINLTEQPNAANLTSWLILARQEIVSASGRTAHEIVPWLLHAENLKTPLTALADPGSYSTLDSKLASALLRVAKGQVQFALQLHCQSMHKQGKFATGRQLLQIFVREFSVDAENAALYDIHDLLAVRWLGDGQLAHFMQAWTLAVSKLATDPGEAVLRSVLWSLMRRSTSMAHDLMLYERRAADDPLKTYSELVRILQRQVMKDQHDRNRGVVVRAREPGVLSTPAAPGPANQEQKKGQCFNFAKTGKCKFGDKCRYSHSRASSPAAPAPGQFRTSRSPSGGKPRKPIGRGN